MTCVTVFTVDPPEDLLLPEDDEEEEELFAVPEEEETTGAALAISLASAIGTALLVDGVRIDIELRSFLNTYRWHQLGEPRAPLVVQCCLFISIVVKNKP